MIGVKEVLNSSWRMVWIKNKLGTSMFIVNLRKVHHNLLVPPRNRPSVLKLLAVCVVCKLLFAVVVRSPYPNLKVFCTCTYAALSCFVHYAALCAKNAALATRG